MKFLPADMIMVRRLLPVLGLVALASTGLSGCANVASPISSPNSGVQRVDPGTVANTTLGYDATDLNLIAEKMTQSLLESQALNGRPTLAIATVKNKTGEYIDTNNILNTIQTQVLKSGKVRFTRSVGELGGAVEQLSTTNNSGLYDKKTAPKVGRMIAAKYTLEGEFTSIGDVRRDKDLFYKFTLKLIETESGLIEWVDEKQIRKIKS